MLTKAIVVGAVLMISGSMFGCQGTSTSESVLAMNPATGEEREFDSPSDVPEGWVTCADDACPDPLPCAQIDESACTVRSDCAPIYAEGGFEGCVDGGVPTCAPDACGPALGMPNYQCWDGSLGGPTGRCIDQGQGCGWEVIECPPPPACGPDDCGPPAPGAPNFICDDGTIGGPVCAPTSDGQCGWAFVDCPEAGTCDDVAKCGPALGMPAYVCEDGSTGGNTGKCLDNGDGTCSWEIRDCPTTP